MRSDEEGTEQRTLWCGNISDQVADDILYELFLQAGPLEGVRRPRDPNGRPKSFAFVVYKHECSVPYALELFRGEKLFNRLLNLSSRSNHQHHIPVLDTHLTEFTEDKHQHRRESQDHRTEWKHPRKERDDNAPKSWGELNALRGKGSLLNGHSSVRRDDLVGAPMHSRESKPQEISTSMTDFEKLLQMGSQMMMPNVMNPAMAMFGGLPPPVMCPINMMGPMGPMGLNMYPSMQGGMSGGQRVSPEKERRSEYEGRGSRRDHPYQDKRHSSQYDNRRHSDNYNHSRHDRGYSSSRSSHERERRDRRSR